MKKKAYELFVFDQTGLGKVASKVVLVVGDTAEVIKRKAYTAIGLNTGRAMRLCKIAVQDENGQATKKIGSGCTIFVQPDHEAIRELRRELGCGSGVTFDFNDYINGIEQATEAFTSAMDRIGKMWTN